jgi:hypothetical protein
MILLKDDIIIYAGISNNGISRGLTPHHQGYQNKEPLPLVLETDKFVIYPVKDYKKALIIEDLIISYYKPKYNKRIKNLNKMDKDRGK